MTYALRMSLITAAVAVFIFVIYNIRKSKMRISDSLFWFFFSLFLVILAFNPSVIVRIARRLGIISIANFVFLLVIALLLIRIFQMDVHISQLNTKINNLVQDLGIKEHDEKENSK